MAERFALTRHEPIIRSYRLRGSQNYIPQAAPSNDAACVLVRDPEEWRRQVNGLIVHVDTMCRGVRQRLALDGRVYEPMSANYISLLDSLSLEMMSYAYDTPGVVGHPSVNSAFVPELHFPRTSGAYTDPRFSDDEELLGYADMLARREANRRRAFGLPPLAVPGAPSATRSYRLELRQPHGPSVRAARGLTRESARDRRQRRDREQTVDRLRACGMLTTNRSTRRNIRPSPPSASAGSSTAEPLTVTLVPSRMRMSTPGPRDTMPGFTSTLRDPRAGSSRGDLDVLAHVAASTDRMAAASVSAAAATVCVDVPEGLSKLTALMDVDPVMARFLSPSTPEVRTEEPSSFPGPAFGELVALGEPLLSPPDLSRLIHTMRCLQAARSNAGNALDAAMAEIEHGEVQQEVRPDHPFVAGNLSAPPADLGEITDADFRAVFGEELDAVLNADVTDTA